MPDDLRPIRPLPAESLRGIAPAKILGSPPRFEWVDPCSLFTEPSYQRDVTASGVSLVRSIYSEFDWSKFETPICIQLPTGELVVIDGQHTAIGAAFHPDVDLIPVMIVSAGAVAGRAMLFVGHNCDRVNLTPMSIFRAEIVAGDEIAQRMDRACRVSGVTILDNSINLRNKHPVGSTIAIGTMRALAKRLGEEFLARVLRVLVAAQRGPIKAGELGAAALVLEHHGDRPIIDDRLREVICAKTAEAWDAMARVETADQKVKIQIAIAAAWCRELDLRLRPKRKQPGPAPKKVVAAAAPKPQMTPAPKRVMTPAPPRPPLQPKAAPKPPAATPDAMMIRHNGVEIDPRRLELTHRGTTVQLRREPEVATLAALSRIMPALMDGLRLANAAFGKHADAPIWLRGLVDEVNPIIQRARLEIKIIPKVGARLDDLGPA